MKSQDHPAHAIYTDAYSVPPPASRVDVLRRHTANFWLASRWFARRLSLRAR